MKELGVKLTKSSYSYENPNGTVTFEWDNEDEPEKLFFLEIGKETFGYFIQEKDKSIEYIDESKDMVLLRKNLQNFLYGK